jgi:hypothetical protein
MRLEGTASKNGLSGQSETVPKRLPNIAGNAENLPGCPKIVDMGCIPS